MALPLVEGPPIRSGAAVSSVRKYAQELRGFEVRPLLV
jgi:hypothetical protein